MFAGWRRQGFAAHLKFSESYDPSLPPVFANRDQLIQVLLNLVKNAAESITSAASDTHGEITLTTAYRPRCSPGHSRVDAAGPPAVGGDGQG